ncbi:hypothetical protein HanXRQr2_Chr11g0503701 [Helianthus annuus]|uniref:Uncharacterized protein n=1 Tax=Helianthus annuus TaxID=4232 RepID=A0A9K3HS58_HELAN|nr:hypothetical protein HanXRQr2_Chr11g0503701 [Helianthus annuus]
MAKIKGLILLLSDCRKCCTEDSNDSTSEVLILYFPLCNLGPLSGRSGLEFAHP